MSVNYEKSTRFEQHSGILSKVSIVIPAYNAGLTLSACIDSILSQSHDDIEIIIINDGSVDNTDEVCNEYVKVDNRITAIRQENGGVSSARNRGIIESSGRYLTFVDADDTLRDGAIETMINTIQSTGADCVRMSCEVTVKGVTRRLEEKVALGLHAGAGVQELMYDAMTGGMLCYSGLLLVKSDIVKTNDVLFPVGVSMMEDAWFYVDLLSKLKSVYLSDVVTYSYVIHDQSASRSMHGFADKVASVMEVNGYVMRNNFLNHKHIGEVNALHVSVITSLLMVRADRAKSVDDIRMMMGVIVENKEILKLYENASLGCLTLYNRLATWSVVKNRLTIVKLLLVIRKMSGK